MAELTMLKCVLCRLASMWSLCIGRDTAVDEIYNG
jgi:hypothetical protein